MFESYRTLEQVPSDFGPCVLTIGNFDGVHLGHQRILSRAVELARESGLRAAALTFDPHPTKVVRPERAPLLLSSIEQRLECFKQLGMDAAVVMPFTPAVAALSPEEFVDQVVVERLAARGVVVGSNFRFGRRHAGDVETLIRLGDSRGFVAEAVDPVEAGGAPISSTRIREALAAGDLDAAKKFLGGPFRLRGAVISGRGVGGKLTAPTLNIDPDSELFPADGVYVTQTHDLAGADSWPSVTNVGIRPTFGLEDRTVETHLIDTFDGRALERIEVRFLMRLRPEKKFDSSDELKAQIQADVERARRYFEETPR